MLSSPTRYFYPFTTLLIGSFIAGPGFGLAGAMAMWYLLTYRNLVFQSWPGIQKMNSAALGFMLTIIIIGLEIGLVASLGWAMQMSNKP